jgi:2-polyprenyl-6-methoxyphenol hydroxylase-like FAD-dependent oxidoreductase
VFAASLDGYALISNKSTWRNFPWICNERWSFRNMVRVGDALHMAHFSIGSGTRLALEDVIASVKALEAAPGNLSSALAEKQNAVRLLKNSFMRRRPVRIGTSVFRSTCGSRRSISP